MYMIEYITEGLFSVLEWIGLFLRDLFVVPVIEGDPVGRWMALLPLVGIGAAFTVFKFGIRIVRSFAFGF